MFCFYKQLHYLKMSKKSSRGVTKNQLRNQIYSIDGRRRHAWGMYFESERSYYACKQRCYNLLKKLDKSNNFTLPTHIIEEFKEMMVELKKKY